MTTRSLDEGASEAAGADAPTLCLGLCADAVLVPALRVSLAGVEELTIGRGERRSQRIGKQVELTLPDPFLSTRHARVTFTLGRWQVTDAGSKNGSLLNGQPVE